MNNNNSNKNNKNKKYYKKNYYKKNNANNAYKNNANNKLKITYDSLMHANTITESNKNDNMSKIAIMRYIAITIILFAIIFGSLLLFRKI